MLLAPDTTYQRPQFPGIWQLGSQEREALQDRLPGIAEALSRVSRSYLGTDITVGTPQLLWQRSELAKIEEIGGPTLISHFGDSHQMVTRMPRPLAARCVGPLLGYSPKLEPSPEELTRVDLAILQPYLEALADSALGVLFGSHGRHQMLPAGGPQPQLVSESFAIAVPLWSSTSPHSIMMAIPTVAWHNNHTANTDPIRLKHSQLYALPVQLEAILPAPSLELAELQTMAQGDVLLLPNGSKMIVHLQVAGRTLAAGQPGAQGRQLSVRLLETNTYSGSQTAMKKYPNTTPQSEQPLPSAQSLEAIRTDETSLESPGTIPVQLQIRLGQVVMSLGELQELRAGAVVSLGRNLDDPVEILAGNKLVARGEIVAVEDQLGVRILQVANPEQVQSEAAQ